MEEGDEEEEDFEEEEEGSFEEAVAPLNCEETPTMAGPCFPFSEAAHRLEANFVARMASEEGIGKRSGMRNIAASKPCYSVR